MKQELMNGFQTIFGEGGSVFVFFAPGRVNLIGEYTDFNGGHVFPCALTMGTYAAVRKREDGLLRLYSANFPEKGIVEAPLINLSYAKQDDWANYVKGVIWAFSEAGHSIDQGFDFYCMGTIPNKSGLSSSASIEVLTGKILIDIYGFPVDMVECALLCQKAENIFVGVNCGIMDQFAIAKGKKDSAVFLDTGTLGFEYVPVKLTGMKIVISNTNKKRGLEDSKYNERRAQCEEALKDIRTRLSIQALCDLNEAEFEEVKQAVLDPLCRKRAKHAVYENQRTIKAVELLKQGNIKAFGELLNASHVSLRDDFEVSGKELDILAAAAWEQEGVLGSRMTGAGFGGCTVSIVKEECVDNFIKSVGLLYREAVGYEADFYVVDIGDGPVQLL